MNSNQAYLEGYYEYLLHVRKLKKDSVKDVKCTFNKVKSFIDERKANEQFWYFEIDEFVAFFNYAEEKGMSPKSIGKFVTHLRSFLEYSWRVGKIKKNVLDGFSIKNAQVRIPPRVLSLKELRTTREFKQ